MSLASFATLQRSRRSCKPSWRYRSSSSFLDAHLPASRNSLKADVGARPSTSETNGRRCVERFERCKGEANPRKGSEYSQEHTNPKKCPEGTAAGGGLGMQNGSKKEGLKWERACGGLRYTAGALGDGVTGQNTSSSRREPHQRKGHGYFSC